MPRPQSYSLGRGRVGYHLTVSETDVAIAHDYLTQRGGAERVVLAMTRAFPGAPIYTTLYDRESTYPDFEQQHVRASWLNRLRPFRRYHRFALPLLAPVANGIRIEARYTIVSSSGWAHGFRASGAKIVYCYSPARWLYQPAAYLGSSKIAPQRWILKMMAPALKRWDKRQASTATKYLAISTVVAQRIRETYGFEAEVVPAPHSVDITLPQEPVDLSAIDNADHFYLCISRLLPYKNVDVVIDALMTLELPLVVVGAGPDERRLRSRIRGGNVVMLKNLTDGQMRWLYSKCAAVVSASYEDFGLTPIEAAAYGKPSVVLRWGGFLDTISEGRSGVYFNEPTSASISEAIVRCRATEWDPDAIRAQASKFSEESFIRRLRAEIEGVEDPA